MSLVSGISTKDMKRYFSEDAYLLLQKYTFSKCGRIIGEKTAKKKNGSYYFRLCMNCKNHIKKYFNER